MGKSLGNYIGVGESAYEMFAKVMSIPDELMRQWFELLTNRSSEDVARLTNPTHSHPRQAKETLGKDIVAGYHCEQAATEAALEWQRRFSQRQDPTDIPEAQLATAELVDGKILVPKLLVLLKLAASNNEARRAVEGGAVTIGAERTRITDPKAAIGVVDGLVVRVGNRRVVRIRIV